MVLMQDLSVTNIAKFQFNSLTIIFNKSVKLCNNIKGKLYGKKKLNLEPEVNFFEYEILSIIELKCYLNRMFWSLSCQ